MDVVKGFNDELSSIYETKPPVSRAKMTLLTKKAIKGIKFYKHIVQSMEKFIQKCRPEYKVPGLYVIDSVVRQSRHQFGQEKDVFMPRLCKNIINTFKHLYKCPPEEKQRIVRVLNLWQKNNVFPPDIVQQLLAMGGTSAATAAVPVEPAASREDEPSTSGVEQPSSSAVATQPDAGALTNILAQLLANPNNPQIQQLTGLLSTSQQAQLQDLVLQVKGQKQEEPVKEEPPEIVQPDPPQEQVSVFQPRQDNNVPPFLQTEPGTARHDHLPRPTPSFNRDILDYDYSDDESPKSQQEKHHHKPGIDLELLAKLPTVDQLKQLSAAPGGQISNGDGFGVGFPKQDADDRARDQAIFNKQIHHQAPPERNEGERSQDDRSSRSTSRRRRSRSRKRSRSRSRDRHRHHKRSRSRDRHRRRSRSHDRHRSSHHRHSRSTDREREKEREREKKGLPPLKEGCVSLCSKTLWIGNVASKVSQQEIKAEVEMHGPMESLNMIPPRGCAYICMEKREDASKALHKLRHARVGGKQLKADWAPGKEVKEEFKEFWVKEHGVNYIPLTKVADRLLTLKAEGFIDMESVPEDKRAQFEITEDEKTDDDLSEPPQPVVGPGQGLVNPQLVPGGVPVMMRPAFGFQPMNPGMGQFGSVPQPRMPGFQLPSQMPAQPPRQVVAAPPVPAPETPSPQKQEPQEEIMDGAQKAAAVAASIMASVQPAALAQSRFQGVGQMPMQIRMLPGMPPHQPMMHGQRIGMMPIRMGMPMQFRPGFARVPMAQQMVPFQQPQMQRMGQPMVQAMPQGPMRMPGGPMRMRSPGFLRQPLDHPMDIEMDMKQDKREEEPMKEEPDPGQGQPPEEKIHPGMIRPPMGRPPAMEEGRMRMGERPPLGDGRPPPHMEDRPPPFGFRRSPPPGRFGFGGRRPPMDGPRFPDRSRFPDRGMDRDDRRRDDMRRRDRSPERSRDRDRGRDRGMRDRRFDDRDRRGGPGFGGDWGRDRGRFGGRGDFGRDRGGRGGFGRGGFGGGRGRFEEEVDEEDLEYQRKREEVLRQRREKEDEYVVEEVDLSAFGLPSGFGAATDAEEGEEPKEEKKEDDRRRDRDRRDDRDRDRDDRDRDDRRDRRRDDRDRSRRHRSRDRSRDRDRDRRSDDKRDGRSSRDDEKPRDKRRKVEDEEKEKSKVPEGAPDAGSHDNKPDDTPQSSAVAATSEEGQDHGQQISETSQEFRELANHGEESQEPLPASSSQQSPKMLPPDPPKESSSQSFEDSFESSQKAHEPSLQQNYEDNCEPSRELLSQGHGENHEPPAHDLDSSLGDRKISDSAHEQREQLIHAELEVENENQAPSKPPDFQCRITNPDSVVGSEPPAPPSNEKSEENLSQDVAME